MSYKVRNKRNDDGTYTLSFGGGRKKITATMSQTDDGWKVTDGENVGTHDRMKDCKEAWGEWAATAYYVQDQPKKTSPPDRTKRSGPPAYRPRTRPETIDYEFAADPFDPAYKYPPDHEDPDKKNKLTPLGVLVEVAAWADRHQKEIGKIIPKSSPFYPMLKSVRDCLSREIVIESPELGDDPDGE